MACDLSLGRLEQCKQNVGGIKAIYFVNYDGTLVSGATVSGDEITALAGATPCYKYELFGDGNSFNEENNVSIENGTSFWEGTGTFVLKVQDAATQAELKNASYGRPHVIVEDYNGKFRLAGAEHGCQVQVGTATGGAMGDLNGYNLTITARETNPAYFIESTVMGDVAGFTITEGV